MCWGWVMPDRFVGGFVATSVAPGAAGRAWRERVAPPPLPWAQTRTRTDSAARACRVASSPSRRQFVSGCAAQGPSKANRGCACTACRWRRDRARAPAADGSTAAAAGSRPERT
eukprot:2505562-Prymnesium_polylepis.2